MKRNFYALFALLTALSGPLALTPPAIRSASAAVQTSDDTRSQGDEDDSEDQIRSRIEQAHNQPNCIFADENRDAPEALIVLPEDFDYELFAGEEACEVPEVVEPKAVAESASEGLPAESIPFLFEDELPSGSMCLPQPEWSTNVQPWDGPAVAGIESLPLVDPNIDAAPISGGEFAASLLLRSAYAIYSGLSNAAVVASSESTNGIRLLESYKAELTNSLYEAVTGSAKASWEDLLCNFTSFSHNLTRKEVAAIPVHQAERPFCYCWETPDSEHEVNEESHVEAPIAQNELEFSQPIDATEPAICADLLPKVPEFELQLNQTLPLQNDAVGQPQNEADATLPGSQELTLNELGEFAKQAWGILVDQAVKIDQWTKDYDFEPFSPAESENLTDSE